MRRCETTVAAVTKIQHPRCNPSSEVSWPPAKRARKVTAASSAMTSCPRLVTRMDSKANRPADYDQRTQCASCHREHQGRRESLVDLTNAQCQVCHEAPFESFASGHPEFSTGLENERPTIRFDHVKHLQTHLPASGLAAESCAGCHSLDVDGERMRTGSFEETCAACHEGEVLGSEQVDGRGLNVFGLPALDLMALEESGLELGAWPADAEFGESPLSPFLALLLSTDPEARSELAAYRKIDPLDMLEADRESKEVVLGIAWRIKDLCAEISREGHASLEARLELLAGEELSPRALAELCGGLSSEVASESLSEWFPELERELMQKSTCEPIPRVDPELNIDSDSARESWVGNGGWYSQNLDPSLRYRPRGHDDAFMREWIEFAHQLASDPSILEAKVLLKEIFAPGKAGVCAKCHVAPDPGSKFRWKDTPRQSTTRGLTHFKHSTHMPMLKDRSCATCHVLEAGETSIEFEPLTRQTCLECHGEEGASQACTTCHMYHASGASRVRLENSLSDRVRLLEER